MIEYQTVGWIGTATLLSSYFLLSAKMIGHKSAIYLTLNLLGASGLLYASLPLGAVQPLILNGAFAIFSILGLLNINLIKIKGGLLTAWIAASAVGLAHGYVENSIYETLSMVGALMLLSNYLLLTQEQINSKQFLMSNFVANVSFLPVLVITENWPNIGMQVMAISITIFGIWKHFQNLKSSEVVNV